MIKFTTPKYQIKEQLRKSTARLIQNIEVGDLVQFTTKVMNQEFDHLVANGAKFDLTNSIQIKVFKAAEQGHYHEVSELPLNYAANLNQYFHEGPIDLSICKKVPVFRMDEIDELTMNITR